MKAGVKIFGIKDQQFLDEAVENADFIETMAIRGGNYEFLKSYNKPIVIHAEHRDFGINPADYSKSAINSASLDFAIKTADMLDAKKIICHPGVLEDKNCSEQTSVDFFKNIKDKRVIIENLPLIDYNGKYTKSLCYDLLSSAEFLQKVGKGLCLDFTHAILSAILLGKKDQDEFVIGYLKMNPKHFHFCDMKLAKLKDHLSLGEGDLNVIHYKKLIGKGCEVTLETTTSAAKVKRDVSIMKA
ncbi:MAG: TIM barrel protein [archaeon]